jgi:protease IV
MPDTKTSGRIIIVFFVITVIVSCYLIIISAKSGRSKETAFRSDIKSLWPGRTAVYPNNTIAVLNIFSIINYNEDTDYFGFRRNGAIYWIEMLQSIEDNPNIKAVILRINSPGGTVAATQEIYNEIKRLKDKGKIVTVSMGDLAASGAYYIACAADYIVANPGTLTGSIGVILAGFDLSELFKKIGISYNVIKSGKNKDIFSSYRKMTQEEYQLLNELILDTYNQFFEAVSEGRKIKPDELKPLADGRIFSGRQALKAKLIDELGDFEKTVSVTAKLSEISGKPNVVELKPDVDNILKYLTYSMGQAFSSQKSIKLIDSPKGLPGNNNTPLLYLYDF